MKCNSHRRRPGHRTCPPVAPGAGSLASCCPSRLSWWESPTCLAQYQAFSVGDAAIPAGAIGRVEARVIEASLALLEAAHVGFIFRDPSRHLVAGKSSRFRHLDSSRAHPCGEEEHQLLFLFRGERFRRRLNLLEFAHAEKLSHQEQRDNNSMAIRHVSPPPRRAPHSPMILTSARLRRRPSNSP